jgi:hypothetical protein
MSDSSSHGGQPDRERLDILERWVRELVDGLERTYDLMERVLEAVEHHLGVATPGATASVKARTKGAAPDPPGRRSSTVIPSSSPTR